MKGEDQERRAPEENFGCAVGKGGGGGGLRGGDSLIRRIFIKLGTVVSGD